MLFWHGGNLNEFDQATKHRKGRTEFGPGLYATTHYDTAKKYSKGGKKFYILDIEKGKEINEVSLDMESVKKFVAENIAKKKGSELLERLSERTNNNKLSARIFLNNILNDELIKASKMNDLREFLVRNGVDYELVSNAFGWHEMMIVLYNMNKISEMKQVSPKDKIETYDLKDIYESANIKSVVASKRINRILNAANSLMKNSRFASSNEFIINEQYLQNPVKGYENPTPKQINECKSYGQVRAILLDDNMYVWNEAVHAAAAKALEITGNSNIIPLNIYLSGNKIEGVEVTDFSNRTKWKHNPKLKNAIIKNKWIKLYSGGDSLKDPEFIHYYDESINGPWHEMKPSKKTARILYIAENLEQDYMGEHKAPTNDGYSQPIHNVEEFYPDIYTRGGSEYVAMSEDREGLSIILEAHERPNFKVKVYRAIPDINKDIKEKVDTAQNALQSLIASKNHRAVKKSREAQNLIYSLMDKYPIEEHDYDSQQDLMIEDLENQIDDLKSQSKEKIKLEKGNWVSPSQRYVKMHGMSALNGNYKIISKTVKAKDLYTDGNSLSEWGYDPS